MTAPWRIYSTGRDGYASNFREYRLGPRLTGRASDSRSEECCPAGQQVPPNRMYAGKGTPGRPRTLPPPSTSSTAHITRRASLRSRRRPRSTSRATPPSPSSSTASSPRALRSALQPRSTASERRCSASGGMRGDRSFQTARNTIARKGAFDLASVAVEDSASSSCDPIASLCRPSVAPRVDSFDRRHTRCVRPAPCDQLRSRSSSSQRHQRAATAPPGTTGPSPRHQRLRAP